MKQIFPLVALAGVAACAFGQDVAPDPRAATLPAHAIWLESLDTDTMEQEYGTPRRSRSVEGKLLTLGGAVYTHGIGTHARSEWRIALNGAATRFLADVGLDSEKTGAGSVIFEVWVDGKRAATTGVMRGGQPAQRISVDLAEAKQLLLIVEDGGDGIDSDHADWAGAMLLLAPGATGKPQAIAGTPQEPTRAIAMNPDSPEPALHGPRVVGATPGRPFLYRIPATGEGRLLFIVRNLPAGITCDIDTGILSGSLRQAGTTVVQLAVRGPHGSDTRNLVIVGGDHKLSQTPTLGWNSWNVWGTRVDAGKVRDAADSLISGGLAAHGFSYVNIDDAWEGKRDESGNITTNEKFGDMKALGDYIHSKGLKMGIYSSPGPQTCGGYEGSYGHEMQDARTWGAWGVDYLKHDWCSYGNVATGEGRERFVKPYALMRTALDSAGRDIVYSLCQYGMGNVWEWGASPQVGANSWRTTGDITDRWSSLSGIGFEQNGHEKYAAPGHWNDPDMLVVGAMGFGNPHPTRLSGNEQITHMSLWSLQSAPLLIGCDLTRLDSFTRALLTNDEVLDVNQDPMGKPAGRVAANGNSKTGTEVWARPLFDGTQAVGLFNRGVHAAKVTARWQDLGLRGSQPVRDLWQRRDLAPASGDITLMVPAHGAILLKIGTPQRTEYTL